MTYSASRQRVMLFLNGEPVGAPGHATITPAQVNMAQAWLGRSNHAHDLYTNARMEDFRFYSGALRCGQSF